MRSFAGRCWRGRRADEHAARRDCDRLADAFVLTVALSSSSLQLTWASDRGAADPAARREDLGLYDRDETLLRKTTLDEAPKLFQLATLCALVAWLAGG
jgi:hypothetical protein